MDKGEEESRQQQQNKLVEVLGSRTHHPQETQSLVAKLRMTLKKKKVIIIVAIRKQH